MFSCGLFVLLLVVGLNKASTEQQNVSINNTEALVQLIQMVINQNKLSENDLNEETELDEPVPHAFPKEFNLSAYIGYIENPKIFRNVLQVEIMYNVRFDTGILNNPTISLKYDATELGDYILPMGLELVALNDRTDRMDLLGAKIDYILYKQHKDGIAELQIKTKHGLDCAFKLDYYPFDSHYCRINILPFSMAVPASKVNWAGHGNSPELRIHPNYGLTEFTLNEYVADYCEDLQYCLVIRFKFQRRMAYLLTTTFCPTICVVIVAWLSFFIHPSAVPARVGMGVTCVLTVITLSLKQTMNVGYVTSLDAWYLGVLLFAAFPLVEYALVSTFTRISAELKAIIVVKSLQEKQDNRTEADTYGQLAQQLDSYCRIVYPIVTFVFVLIFVIVNLAFAPGNIDQMTDKEYLEQLSNEILELQKVYAEMVV